MKKNKVIKAALYLRVPPSDGTPAELLKIEESFLEQEKVCRKFCQSQNIEVNEDHVYRDVCEGDESFHFREGLGELIYAPTKARGCDIVVISRLDRLARRTKTLLEILNEFELENVGIRSATEPFGLTTKDGFMVTLLNVMSKMERDIIKARGQCHCCDCSVCV